ncbi:hypothetical protein [Myxococcus xanthus]
MPGARGGCRRCVGVLVPTLKPEYADILRKVDLVERGVPGVAREALKKQLERSCGSCAAHGCLDCSCKPSHRAGEALAPGSADV